MEKTNLIFQKLYFFLEKEWLWKTISFSILFLYLGPLVVLGESTNMLVYDNLDSNVVWLKILAESGMIFAPSDAIIPNMMNGLPRLSYGSEFNVLLWLYYFFTPIIAYIINEVLIHTVAFISMFLLTNRYIVPKHLHHRHVIAYSTALIFSLQPFWPSAGLSIAVLPLVTYIFINFYNHTSSKIDWILLITIPFYTSFVLVYIFYIGFMALFIIIQSIYTKKLNKRFFSAFALFLLIYLFVEYRLLFSIILHHDFISHRTEFYVFFTEPFSEATQKFYQFFLKGHEIHLHSAQMPLMLPYILFAMLLQFSSHRFNAKESFILMFIFITSVTLGLWTDVLNSPYGIPIIILVSLSYMLYYRTLNKLNLSILAMIFISSFYGYTFYRGFDFITEIFPIFNSFSLARASFVQPLFLTISIALSSIVLFKKLHFPLLFISFILIWQINISFDASLYSIKKQINKSSFNAYYTPDIFKKIKKDIPEDLENVRFVSYGIEPAAALFNGLYTVDGYTTNYPLAYKHTFSNVNQHTTPIFSADNWGSKLYISSIRSDIGSYKKGLTIEILQFDEDTLLTINTDYLLSSYKLLNPQSKKLTLWHSYIGKEDSWDIYLYKFQNE